MLHFLSLLFSFVLVARYAGAASIIKLDTDLSVSPSTKNSYQSIYCGYKARAAYSGPVIKLRKGAAEQDFYGSYDLTTVSGGGGQTLQDWLGAGIKKAFVVTWYDQSGNNRHATQPNQALQPSFDVDSKYVDFKTLGMYLLLPGTIFPVGNSPYSFILQHGIINNNLGNVFAVGNMVNSQANSFRRDGSANNYVNYWWDVDFAVGGKYVANNIVSSTHDGSKRTMYFDRVLYGSQNGVHNYVQTDGRMGMQAYNSGGYDERLNGEIYFLVTSNIVIPDADRLLIESGGTISASTVAPSVMPSAMPSAGPTVVPTTAPSKIPTIAPSASPSISPSAVPSSVPSLVPSITPTSSPTCSPTASPSTSPSINPSSAPSVTPSSVPSVAPTLAVPEYSLTLSARSFKYFEVRVFTEANERVFPVSYNLVDCAENAGAVIWGHESTPITEDTNTCVYGLPRHYWCECSALVNGNKPKLTLNFGGTVFDRVELLILDWVDGEVTVSDSANNIVLFTASRAGGPLVGEEFVGYDHLNLLQIAPSVVPTVVPSSLPTTIPSWTPTTKPTVPSVVPTQTPTMAPTTTVPSAKPSVTPSMVPSAAPSFTAQYTITLTAKTFKYFEVRVYTHDNLRIFPVSYELEHCPENAGVAVWNDQTTEDTNTCVYGYPRNFWCQCSAVADEKPKLVLHMGHTVFDRVELLLLNWEDGEVTVTDEANHETFLSATQNGVGNEFVTFGNLNLEHAAPVARRLLRGA